MQQTKTVNPVNFLNSWQFTECTRTLPSVTRTYAGQPQMYYQLLSVFWATLIMIEGYRGSLKSFSSP